MAITFDNTKLLYKGNSIELFRMFLEVKNYTMINRTVWKKILYGYKTDTKKYIPNDKCKHCNESLSR